MKLTAPAGSATLSAMSHTVRKLIALLMLLWLPLSSGSAVAASLAMQLPNGSCHESGAMSQHAMNDRQMMQQHDHQMMQQHDHQMMQHDDQTSPTDPSSACATCAVCHLACSGFAVAQSPVASLVATTMQIVTFKPEIFISHVSAPLLPPPLARV